MTALRLDLELLTADGDELLQVGRQLATFPLRDRMRREVVPAMACSFDADIELAMR